MWVPVNPGVGLTPEREGWAPDRLGIPGMEMLLGSGRAEGAGKGRPHFHIHGGIPMYGSRVKLLAREGRDPRETREGRDPREAETPERAETPDRAESFTVRGCRAASPGWLQCTLNALGILNIVYRKQPRFVYSIYI